MRLLPLGIALTLALAFAACSGAPHHAPRCANSPQVPCLVGEECSLDTSRNCEMCRCAEPYEVRQEQTDPIGPASPE